VWQNDAARARLLVEKARNVRIAPLRLESLGRDRRERIRHHNRDGVQERNDVDANHRVENPVQRWTATERGEKCSRFVAVDRYAPAACSGEEGNHGEPDEESKVYEDAPTRDGFE